MGFALLLLFTVACYTAFGIVATKATPDIDPSLSASLISTVGVLLPLAYYVVTVVVLNRSPVDTNARGIGLSLLAGVAIAAFSVGLINVFARGEVGYTFPLVYGGAIVAGAAAGWFLLDQRPNALHLAGLAVTSLGVGMVAIANR
jgi:drug/metabolite transporter (DMT)-like permease